MISRYLPALVVVLLVTGLAMGIVGLFADWDDVVRAGILISLTALPAVVVWQSDRAHQVERDQIAAAHAAGYRLALEHVARGLLDQPPPSGGDRTDGTTPDRAARVHPATCHPDNVRQLDDARHVRPEQKAL